MEYDVAFSFAGEDRKYVEAVAGQLKKLGIRVFYDRFETANLWGKDLYTHLQDVYEKQAKYTVIFISEHYARKLWTNHERKIAQARAFTESREYILPARFDDTEIEGILPTTGFIDLRKISFNEFCNLIVDKIKSNSIIQNTTLQAVKKTDVFSSPPKINTYEPLLKKPILEDLPIIGKRDSDTSKLKMLSNEELILVNRERISDKLPIIEKGVKNTSLSPHYFFIEADEELKELAPLSMRFTAGLFDLIIGTFTSLILLAPFLLTKGNWVSIAGLLAFLIINSVILFVYLTTSISIFGKTVGMKIFSLETVDIEENDYPTIYQAAVNSAVYLISLALGGIGFLPAFFDSERRTAGDLLSGTITIIE